LSSHNTKQCKQLFLKDDIQLLLIADATYCCIQKSSNNFLQRKTYSGQKKRHLVNPFLICATDGTIVDVYGPYRATVNDATIIEDVFKNDSYLRELVKSVDILIADRGFRDCPEQLKSNSI
jgi:hypothetical protein